MTGIEKICARIESDARAEADVTIAQAEAKCEEIRVESDKQAQDKYWTLIRAGVKDCESRVQRLARTAEMESKKQILAFKQEMISKAFDRAIEQIKAMPDDKYIDFLARQAAAAARTGLEEVIFNEADQARGKKAVAKANELLKAKGLYGKLTVSEEIRPIAGGLIIKEGDIESNCSLETLAEMYRAELAAKAASVMFE